MESTDWTAKAAELRAKAGRSSEYSRESFERSDTDGCVTQWCSDFSAREYEAQAEICDDGGTAIFNGLYQGDYRLAAREVRVKNRYTHQTEWKWVLEDDEAEKYGRKWIPAGKRSRIQKQLGLTERKERAPAWAKISGSGTGLSGLTSLYVAVFRTGDKLGGDAVVVPEEEM